MPRSTQRTGRNSSRFNNNNRRRPNRRLRGRKPTNNNQNYIVRLSQVGRICPSRLITVLRYTDTTLTRSASSQAANWSYRSSAFDPDPALGTGAIPGFVELGNLYAEYLVRSMRINVQILNHETAALDCAVWPGVEFHSTNSLSPSDILEYGSNVFGKIRVIPQTAGGNIPKIVSNIAGSELIGRQFLTDVTYAGSTSGNPATTYWWNIGLVEPVAAFAFPFSALVQIDYEIEFFSRRTLES